MKLHEYQAKEILAGFDLPVPRGRQVTSADDAAEAVTEFGGQGVIKAQIYAGGRGKGGGVKLVRSADEATQAYNDINGMTLITPQTGPEGRVVRRVMAEEMLAIKKEYYFSVLVDRAEAKVTLMASEAGGMNIEEVAAQEPEKIVTVGLDPAVGFSAYAARELGFGIGLDAKLIRPFHAFVAKAAKAFMTIDASLLEINPLVLTEDDEWVAGDAKVTLDDNALFRHKDLAELDDPDESDPLDWEARKAGLNYIRLDGNIGAMVNGAGLAMATLDLIKQAGAEPANFLDAGGGASKDMIARGFRIILADPRVKAILVNIFGGILRCDVLAEGMVAAAHEVEMTVPLIIRLSGTNAEQGRQILNDSDLEFLVAEDMTDAAKLVAAQVGGEA